MERRKVGEYIRVIDPEYKDIKGVSTSVEGIESILYYYKIVKAPIVVMAQLMPSKEKDKDFESRIKAGKSIIMPSTFVLEVRANKKEQTTEWICHKHRAGNNAGKKIQTKWVVGQYKDV